MYYCVCLKACSFEGSLLSPALILVMFWIVSINHWFPGYCLFKLSLGSNTQRFIVFSPYQSVLLTVRVCFILEYVEKCNLPCIQNLLRCAFPSRSNTLQLRDGDKHLLHTCIILNFFFTLFRCRLHFGVKLH